MHDTGTTELVARLRASGRRVTRERQLLLRIIEQNPHLDADEIYRRAQATLPQIGLATVYRTLNLLKELGLVRTIDLGENHGHFELQAEDHVHLVCTNCGRVTDIPLPNALRQAAQRRGFVVRRTKLEIFGLCHACAHEGASAKAPRP